MSGVDDFWKGVKEGVADISHEAKEMKDAAVLAGKATKLAGNLTAHPLDLQNAIDAAELTKLASANGENKYAQKAVEAALSQVPGGDLIKNLVKPAGSLAAAAHPVVEPVADAAITAAKTTGLAGKAPTSAMPEIPKEAVAKTVETAGAVAHAVSKNLGAVSHMASSFSSLLDPKVLQEVADMGQKMLKSAMSTSVQTSTSAGLDSVAGMSKAVASATNDIATKIEKAAAALGNALTV